MKILQKSRIDLPSLIIALIPALAICGITSTFILLAASLMFICSNYDSSMKLKKVDWIYVAILCSPLVSAVLSMLVCQNWEWKVVDKYMRYPLGAICFFLLLKRKSGTIDLTILKLGFYSAAVLGLLWASYQKLFLGVHLAGAGVFSITFGEVMTFIATICALEFGSSKCNRLIWRILFFVLAAFASIMSGAKGAWVAYPVLLWIVFDFYYQKNLAKQLTVFSLALLLTASVFWSIPFSRNRIKQAVSDVTGYFTEEEFHPTSQGLRLMMWETALDIAKDYPVFGVGASNVSSELIERCRNSTRKATAGVETYQYCLVHMHNDFFETLSGQGFVGLISYFSCLFFSSIICFKSRNRYSKEMRLWIYIHLLMQVGFAIFSLTVCPRLAARDFLIAFCVLSFAELRRDIYRINP